MPVGGGVNVPAGQQRGFYRECGAADLFRRKLGRARRGGQGDPAEAGGLACPPRAYKIKIEGFADDGGGAESNKTLGLKRADAVRAYLGSLGLASARMRTKTFGNLTERLVHNCNDLSCRAQNRRVVTVLERETGV